MESDCGLEDSSKARALAVNCRAVRIAAQSSRMTVSTCDCLLGKYD